MRNASLCGALGLFVLAASMAACAEGGGAEAGTVADSGQIADVAGDIFIPIDIDNTGDADAPAGPPGAGEFGAECNEPNDCYSGWCIDGPTGAACTRTCIESCPDGYACKNVSGVGADPAFICVSIAVRLCQPCNNNADCRLTPSDASGNLCLALGRAAGADEAGAVFGLEGGDDGSFCGLDCGESGWTCPSGYECATIDGAPAGSERQCVPADGAVCECNGAGIALELSTACAVTNEVGRCGGERVCGEAGLGACDALTPAAEACNGVDDDCDGATDDGVGGEDCMVESEDGQCPGETVCVDGELVCDASEPLPETCNGIDDDCDGDTDEDAFGCAEYYVDEDEDTFGGESSKCLCAPDPVSHYTARNGGDCDDTEPAAHTGADEVCDGVDNDCDGNTDEANAEGCESYYFDGDGDGFGTDEARCQCGPDEAARFTTTEKGDCNDNQPAVNPEAVETCDGFDNDCDQLTDPIGSAGCITFSYDGDNDGWGLLDNAQCRCESSGEYTATKEDNDCDDSNGQINPGGLELCNGKDDDCDGDSDEDFADNDIDGIANCVDPDNDNDGDPNESDCKPFDPAIFSWAEEICDNKDNDCDGSSDLEGSSGCTTYYFDGDNDGFGVAGDQKCLCAPFGKYTADNTLDCADSNPTVNPGTTEVCDSLDNDCDKVIDPIGTTGCTTYYFDADNDDWGLAEDARCLCVPDAMYRATKQPDCDDGAIVVNPGATEACDGIDNDCDLAVDEGAGDNDSDGQPDCIDTDDDNDGDPDVSDCAPLNAAIRNGATEVCDNRDNDCNGGVDEIGASGCEDWYYDGDNDGYGVTSKVRCLCRSEGKYSTQEDGDCNDATSAAHPGAGEVCDSVDNDCDNNTDEENAGGCTVYHRDFDGDSYGHATLSKCLCAPDYVGKYQVTNSSDCYDNNANAKPGQTGWFTTNRGDGSFDYNCNGSAEKQYTVYGECFNGCGNQDGWWGTNPGCGSSGSWLYDCHFDLLDCGIYCCADRTTRTQTCH